MQKIALTLILGPMSAVKNIFFQDYGKYEKDFLYGRLHRPADTCKGQNVNFPQRPRHIPVVENSRFLPSMHVETCVSVHVKPYLRF